MSNSTRGQTLPRRNREESVKSELTEAEKEQQRIINGAPLHTALAEQTNPNSIELEEVEEVKPWREGTPLTADELKAITEKVSMNLPLELLMRLDFILQHDKKNRLLGKKINKTTLFTEALDQYTKSKLKKLGFDVKD
ncbi:hypothetical protein P255_02997 [Acinetobacter brisouii CIP 110357]|uniref:Uncharacterized protein n=1 Tax=Acinetobacter brisouii CIP 110357 TaxID=1341683 RepID=V2UFS7_9GAMM|nr:hypothetical protein [Acinetobacter brisouii]ENV46222.1 hypothetical protein F954_02857 [Acinetobacter brisouii ANC 4119]ESK47515.1 hypothetical protein P255_02997 [Acinetobacter brisouii CIP 110357]